MAVKAVQPKLTPVSLPGILAPSPTTRGTGAPSLAVSKNTTPAAGKPPPAVKMAYDIGVKLAAAPPPGFFSRLGTGLETITNRIGENALNRRVARNMKGQAPTSVYDNVGAAWRTAGKAYQKLDRPVQQTLRRTAQGVGAAGLAAGGAGVGYAMGSEPKPTYSMGPLQWRGPSVGQAYNKYFGGDR